jgi:hypothetical protein
LKGFLNPLSKEMSPLTFVIRQKSTLLFSLEVSITLLHSLKEHYFKGDDYEV